VGAGAFTSQVEPWRARRDASVGASKGPYDVIGRLDPLRRVLARVPAPVQAVAPLGWDPVRLPVDRAGVPDWLRRASRRCWRRDPIRRLPA